MPRTKSEEARSKMLQAGLELSAELGVGNVTLASVVQRSGVAKSTFYRHFDSISELVVCSIEGHSEPDHIPDSGSLKQDLLELAEMLLPRFSKAESRQMITSLVHESTMDLELHELHQRLEVQNGRPLETIVANAVARGEIPAVDNITLAADFIEGPFFKCVLVKQCDMNHAEVTQLIDWICRGLGAKT